MFDDATQYFSQEQTSFEREQPGLIQVYSGLKNDHHPVQLYIDCSDHEQRNNCFCHFDQQQYLTVKPENFPLRLTDFFFLLKKIAQNPSTRLCNIFKICPEDTSLKISLNEIGSIQIETRVNISLPNNQDLPQKQKSLSCMVKEEMRVLKDWLKKQTKKIIEATQLQIKEGLQLAREKLMQQIDEKNKINFNKYKSEIDKENEQNQHQLMKQQASLMKQELNTLKNEVKKLEVDIMKKRGDSARIEQNLQNIDFKINKQVLDVLTTKINSFQMGFFQQIETQIEKYNKKIIQQRQKCKKQILKEIQHLKNNKFQHQSVKQNVGSDNQSFISLNLKKNDSCKSLFFEDKAFRNKVEIPINNAHPSDDMFYDKDRIVNSSDYFQIYKMKDNPEKELAKKETNSELPGNEELENYEKAISNWQAEQNMVHSLSQSSMHLSQKSNSSFRSLISQVNEGQRLKRGSL